MPSMIQLPTRRVLRKFVYSGPGSTSECIFWTTPTNPKQIGNRGFLPHSRCIGPVNGGRLPWFRGVRGVCRNSGNTTDTSSRLWLALQPLPFPFLSFVTLPTFLRGWGVSQPTNQIKDWSDCWPLIFKEMNPQPPALVILLTLWARWNVNNTVNLCNVTRKKNTTVNDWMSVSISILLHNIP